MLVLKMGPVIMITTEKAKSRVRLVAEQMILFAMIFITLARTVNCVNTQVLFKATNITLKKGITALVGGQSERLPQ